MMRRTLRWLNLALATGLFLTYLPASFRRDHKFTGAGLIGTAWGLALLFLLPADAPRQIAVWAGVLCLSVVISDIAEDTLGTHDDPRIVIDEFIGIWTALLFLPHTLLMLVLGFIFFRIFDVKKPGLVNRLAKLPGGWGIVMDDVLAGALANVVLRVVSLVHPYK